MRTDAIIDKRQVLCTNANLIGYGTYKARVGHLIMWQDQTRVMVGRMIGRIHYAPSLGETAKIENWILVVALTGSMLDGLGERWVNPVDVLRIEPIRNQMDILTYFLSDDMVKAPQAEVRRCANQGWSTLAAYREWKANAGLAGRNEEYSVEARMRIGNTPTCGLCSKDHSDMVGCDEVE